MLKLKLQYFGHLMQRAKSLEETLMLGKIEGKRRRGTGASASRETSFSLKRLNIVFIFSDGGQIG